MEETSSPYTYTCHSLVLYNRKEQDLSHLRKKLFLVNELHLKMTDTFTTAPKKGLNDA